jgi:ABC-2 type transport system ATP-binding protein
MIEVEHLSKSYGSTPAIADVTFKVEAGEILGFLGPNGAGKTTTMRILTGYLPASSGTARIAGYDVGENSMAVRSRIGYLPEIPPLYPDMTVEGFLNFVAQIKGVKKIDRARRVNLVLERCHLSEKRRVLICKLSRGFKQRVGIAQAIVHDPPAIILDEPTVGLDPKQIIEVRNLIKSLAREHTIILSTHILPEASMTCDRIAIIDRGQIVATNTPEKLMSDLTRGVNYELEVEVEGNAIELLPILETLPGVGSVESIAGRDVLANRTLIHLKATAGMEPGADIAAAIVSQGWKLHEMRKTVVSLEDVFLELTTEEKTLEDSPGD